MAKKKAKGDFWRDVLSPLGKKLGIGAGKGEWAKGEPERKAKREANKAKAAEKRAKNAAKAKKGPVYKAGKDYTKSSKPAKKVEKKASKDKGDLWSDVIAPAAKKVGIGVGKKDWKAGEPERKAKREAAKEESARKREENRKKMKRGPVYKSKRYAEGGEVSYNWPTRDARNGGKK